MQTTWVASQKLVSRTAWSWAIVSPSPLAASVAANPPATSSDRNPAAEAAVSPIVLRKIRSNTSPSTTAPQPMNTADEYRLVTGGRAGMDMRGRRADGWTGTDTITTAAAARATGRPHPAAEASHDTATRMKAVT